MNGPTKIYRTKQIVNHDIPISLPKCMYRLKNIHETRNNGMVERSSDHVSLSKKNLDIFDQNNQDIPGMASLAARQQKILQQLAELKEQMLSIKANLKINTTNAPLNEPTVSPTILGDQVQITDQDIVIYCSPTYPPYSLAIIQKLWSNCVNLLVKSYVHSTILQLPLQAQALVSAVENFQPICTIPKLSIRLIWKEVGANTQLNLSHHPIIGEINILRYLGRITNGILNYEQSPNPHEIDYLLDVCYRVAISKTKTERASLLPVLSKSLGKSQWLAGRSQISIADIAAYSTLKQLNQSEVNVGFTKWLQRLDNQ